MCGIAGYYWPQRPADPALVRVMCDLVRHRGPDDEGYHVDGGCALGMRRLSIIDLSTGHQPIANEDRTLWVVFNGEIYDYQRLREDLARRSHCLATQSDTEVVIHLYEQEGPEGLRRLRGMFAYAIWDARRRELFLARDRFGKKPLYYSILPQGIYFASELKCLRAAGVPMDLDEQALRLYFQFSYIPEPWSAFRAVRKLPPGSWLVYDSQGNVRRGVYWRLPPPAEKRTPGDTEHAACARIRQAFDEAVRVRMVADVPLGAFLSGGLDSSSVVASMALQSPEPVKTFSIGFREEGFNELPYAGMVARQYRTQHHEILVEPGSVSLVDRLVRHFDEPFGDSSAIPTFIVSEFAARHVKVVLTGDGGDELFAGYDSFRVIQRNRRWDLLPQAARRMLSALASVLPYSAPGKHYLRMISRTTPLERYFETNYAHYFLRQRLLQPGWMLPEDDARLIGQMAHCLLPPSADVITQALYFESTSNLPGDMLVKVDRMSMANSLEVRCPLLDHHLAEVAARCPHEWKIRGNQGKHILIQALGDRLPRALLDRPKAGFGVPLALWFRRQLREYLWDHLTSPGFLNRGIVRPGFVRTLLAEHDSGRRDNSHWLWTLLMLEAWYRHLG